MKFIVYYYTVGKTFSGNEKLQWWEFSDCNDVEDALVRADKIKRPDAVIIGVVPAPGQTFLVTANGIFHEL